MDLKVGRSYRLRISVLGRTEQTVARYLGDGSWDQGFGPVALEIVTILGPARI